MTKSKYTVYVQSRFKAAYVTTQRNCEDMVTELIKMYDNEHVDRIKIVRETEGEKSIVYATPDRRKK